MTAFRAVALPPNTLPPPRCEPSPGRVWRRLVWRTAAVLLAISSTGSAQQNQPAAAWRRLEGRRAAMGTRFSIIVYARPDEDAQAAAAMEAAFQRIGDLDDSLSDYRPDSELSLLGRSAPVQQAAVSDDLWRVLRAGATISRQSQGAFDPTIGPLSLLWRAARKNKTPPTQQQIDAARASVGAIAWLRVDPDKPLVTLGRAGMRLDLGGIAKGFAADEALAVLRHRGFPRALVEGGGDMALGDPPPDRQGWNVGVAALEPDQPSTEVLSLSRCGLATSGDLWQYLEFNGKRYSHLIDPHTGWAIARRSSVTVLGPDATQADAWASAGSVMDPQAAVQTWNRLPGISGMVLWRPLADAAGQKVEGAEAKEPAVQRLVSEGFPASPPTTEDHL